MKMEKNIESKNLKNSNNGFREIFPLADSYSLKYFVGIKNSLEYGQYLLNLISKEEFKKVSSNEELIALFKKLERMFDHPRVFRKIKNEIEIYGYQKVKTALATIFLFESIEKLDVEGVKFALDSGANVNSTKDNLNPIQSLNKAIIKNPYFPPSYILSSNKKSYQTIIAEKFMLIKNILEENLKQKQKT